MEYYVDPFPFIRCSFSGGSSRPSPYIGFMYFAVGANIGFDEYRSRGTGPDGSNAGHFNIDRYKTVPMNGVPQVTGSMHFGEHNPLFSPLVHAGEASQ
jgi:hypothetical protein